jgi:hypothetical protein
VVRSLDQYDIKPLQNVLENTDRICDWYVKLFDVVG